MHRSQLAGFIIDCQTDDLDAAAAFWGAALGLPAEVIDNPQENLYRRLRNQPEDLHIEVQKVSHASRVHLDIESDDVDAEAARLEALGATKIEFRKRWWIMEAPTGQRFCIVRMKHPERGATPNVWP